MAKHTFYIDKPLPDTKRVADHKDFDRLYGPYQTAVRFSFWQGLRRNPRLFASLVIVVAIAYLIYPSVQQERAQKTFSQALLKNSLP